LGSDGGTTLHTQIVTAVEFISNNINSRWSGSITLAASATVQVEHLFNTSSSELTTVFVENGTTLDSATISSSYAVTQINTDIIQIQNITASSKTFQVYIYPHKVLTEAPASSMSEIAGVEPIIDLIFDNDKSLDQFLFQRASYATYFDKDGVLKKASENVPRIDYDPDTGDLRGLYIEGSRTNQLAVSEIFENTTYWTATNLAINTNCENAPNNSFTARKLIASSTNGSHVISSVSTTVIQNSSNSFGTSIFFKPDSSSYRLMIEWKHDGGTATVRGLVSADNKSVSISVPSGVLSDNFNNAFGGVTKCANGWYRAYLVGSAKVGPTYGTVSFYVCDSSGNITFTGDDSSGIFVWGAQYEIGYSVSSYIPSFNKFVCRNYVSTTILNQSNNSTLSGISTSINSVEVSDDQNVLYASNGTFIYELAMSSGSITTLSNTGRTINTTADKLGTIASIRVSGTGSKFYALDTGTSGTNPRVLEYNISAYNFTGVTLSTTYTLPTYLQNVSSLTFSSDGIYAYVSSTKNKSITRFKLGTAWTFSGTVTLEQEIYLTKFDLPLALNQSSYNNMSIDIDSTGTYLYMTAATASNASPSVHIFKMLSAYDLNTAKIVGVDKSALLFTSIAVKPDGITYFAINNPNGTTVTLNKYTNVYSSGSASYWLASGALTTISDHWEQRLSYNYQMSKRAFEPQLLLEKSSTNLCRGSEELSNSTYWTSTNWTWTTDGSSLYAPDFYKKTVDSTTDTGTLVEHYVQQVITTPSNVPYTFHIFVGHNTSLTPYKPVELRIYDSNTANYISVVFDLGQNSILSTSQNGTAKYITARIVDIEENYLNQNWSHIVLTGIPATSDSGSIIVRVQGRNSSNSLTYTTGFSYRMWGAQVESGYSATSYIPTTTASVTRPEDIYVASTYLRNADYALAIGKNFYDQFRFDEGTFYYEADTYGNGSSISASYSTASVLSIGKDDLTYQNYSFNVPLYGSSNTGDTYFTSAFDQGATQVTLTGPVNSIIGTVVRAAVAIATNDFALSVNGSNVSTDTSAQTIISPNRISIGKTTTSQFTQLYGHIKRITFFGERISDSKLKKLTSQTKYSSIPTATKFRSGLASSGTVASISKANTYLNDYQVPKNIRTISPTKADRAVNTIIPVTTESNLNNIAVTCITYSESLGLFVLGSSTAGSLIMLSTNGTQWYLPNTLPFTNSVSSICWSNELGMFVAVFSNIVSNIGLAYSYDGHNWTAVSNSAWASTSWKKVIWASDAGMFVAVGQASIINTMYSYDGINWFLKSLSHNTSWTEVCYSPELNRFVALANGSVGQGAWSSDGIYWNHAQIDQTANNISAITWSPELGYFLASSSVGNQWLSYDGQTWEKTVFNTSMVIINLHWNSDLGRFVGINNNQSGRICYSSDGINWKLSKYQPFVSGSSPTFFQYRYMAWSPQLGQYVIVSQSGDNKKIALTPDIGFTKPRPNTKSSQYMSAGFGLTGATAQITNDTITAVSSLHYLNGEGGVADNLSTINGGVSGNILILKTLSSTGTITIKHNTGNIRLNGAVDFLMDNFSDSLMLMFDVRERKWHEVSRSSNN
jgi:hypothetical protein